MNLTLQISPISNNKLWCGRKFTSKAYKNFEIDVCKILPFCQEESLGKTEIFLHLVYHIKNYGMADTGNMEKAITDMLVKRGYLTDDRYIRAIYQRKERLGPSESEYIDIKISTWKEQDIGI